MTVCAATHGDAGLVLYHGTSDVRVEQIRCEGLRDPFVTDDPALAGYYAEEAADETGGEPIVLSLHGLDRALLAVDLPALEEPVFVGRLGRQWKELARTRGTSPEELLWEAAGGACAKSGVNSWTELSGAASLELTGSAHYRGRVSPDRISDG
jgi:hypothetical protein